MAFANKMGYLVISTGNKTELALGYCTLYGDMSGGLAAISDLDKTDVYAIGQWFNKKYGHTIIPHSIFNKEPSAELAENQVDPFDYDVVSPLVEEIVENHRSKSELVSMGYDVDLVEDRVGDEAREDLGPVVLVVVHEEEDRVGDADVRLGDLDGDRARLDLAEAREAARNIAAAERDGAGEDGREPRVARDHREGPTAVQIDLGES